MDGLRNTFTGTNHGNFVQAHRIDYVHVERACAEPLDIGDVRLRTDLPRTLDPATRSVWSAPGWSRRWGRTGTFS